MPRDKGYPGKNGEALAKHYAGKRYRKSDLVPESAGRSRRVGSNAAVFVTRKGWTVYRLHATPIVKVKGGRVIVSTGGWNTPTTSRHIASALKMLVSDDVYWNVFRAQGGSLCVFAGGVLACRLDKEANRSEFRWEGGKVVNG